MNALLHAIGFLTRIPVPTRVFADAAAAKRSLPFYPLVGLLIGALLCGLSWLLRDAPPLLAAAVLLLAWVGLTGALHVDGLADSADAWVGGLGDRERTLAIMKDPRSGPMAVTAVVLLLLLKFAALASLPRDAWPLLLAAPLIGRGWLVLAFITTPYARGQGMGSALTGASRASNTLALLLALAVVAACGIAAWVGLAMSLLVFIGWRRACLKRLGGFIGDTLGALVELGEAAVLLALLFVIH